MGNKASKVISEKEIKEIEELTHFNAEEIQTLHTSFVKDYPKEVLNEAQFVDRYVKMFPKGDASILAKEIFRTTDADGNGVMTFKEFAEMTSVFSKGSVSEKLNWIFNLFDRDDSGTITIEELEEMLRAIQSINGKCDEKSLVEATETIFHFLDKNKDMAISREEFLKSQMLLH